MAGCSQAFCRLSAGDQRLHEEHAPIGQDDEGHHRNLGWPAVGRLNGAGRISEG